MKKFKNLKEFLETCSEDEREYIYDLYNNASVSDLIDLLFEHLPAKNTIKEIKRYREEMKEEMEWDDAEAKKSNERKCDCDFVGCKGC
jgi:alpha-D-ribose 1-methylphosphonate 5-triphosphate diphosphatase PhnM